MATRMKGKRRRALIIRRKELLVRIKIKQALQKAKRILDMEAISEATQMLKQTGSIQTTNSLIN
jgi:hypothetical protein